MRVDELAGAYFVCPIKAGKIAFEGGKFVREHEVEQQLEKEVTEHKEAIALKVYKIMEKLEGIGIIERKP